MLPGRFLTDTWIPLLARPCQKLYITTIISHTHSLLVKSMSLASYES